MFRNSFLVYLFCTELENQPGSCKFASDLTMLSADALPVISSSINLLYNSPGIGRLFRLDWYNQQVWAAHDPAIFRRFYNLYFSADRDIFSQSASTHRKRWLDLRVTTALYHLTAIPTQWILSSRYSLLFSSVSQWSLLSPKEWATWKFTSVYSAQFLVGKKLWK